MTDEQSSRLDLLSSHHVTKPVSIDRTVICSPHELIAIITHARDVVVYRLNGQIAFTIKNPEASSFDDDDVEDYPEAACLEWSPSGRSLAVAWSDGSWNIHECEKGEVILKQSCGVANVNVTNFLWRPFPVPVPESEELARTLTADADLPRAIASLDVTSILPKLSALPSHGLRSGPDGAKFANQAATDSIFAGAASSPSNGEVDILVVRASDGSVRFMLDGTSHVGTVQSVAGADATHTLPVTKTMLGTFTHDQDNSLSCILQQLPLLELDGALLHVLARCTTQLRALGLYVQRSVQCIAHDYTTGVTYPDRLIKSIGMMLEDREDSRATLPSALLHLAMTGQFQADVLEWLTDIVRDTGLKRWDASISGMYSAVQNHLLIHITPALDRVTIAASRIRGFARLHQGSARFAPDAALFDTILDSTAALRSLVARLLGKCINEWASWRSFVKWLKMQIEIGTAGPGTKSAAESEERESVGIDMHKTLQYIDTVLQSGSALKASVLAGDGSLQSLITQLEDGIDTALHAITSWQGRLFTAPTTVQLDLSSTDEHELPVLRCGRLQEVVANDHLGLRAVILDSPSDLAVYALHPSELSDLQSAPMLRLVLGLTDVIDATYHPHSSRMLLLRSQHGNAQLQLLAFDEDDTHIEVVHAFDGASQFRPVKVLLAGRAGKEFCVVFDTTATQWQVLDLGKVWITTNTKAKG